VSTTRADPPLRLVVRFAWLAVVVAAIVSQHGRRPAAYALVAVAAAGWLGWSSLHRRRPGLAAAALVLMGGAGGVLSLWAGAAIGLLVAAAVAAGSAFELRRALPLTVAGPAVLTAASLASGWSTGLVAGGAAAGLAGLVGGASRRQTAARTEQAARAELARELHDVLAHTLGALAVQLEAAEAVLDGGGDREKLGALIRRSRALVSSGIDEAAGAVRALRDEPVAIADRLEQLAAETEIPLRIDGVPRALPAEPALALYRAAQEAITNARRHSPGAPTTVSLAFRTGSTSVTVANGTTQLESSGGGSGLGLQGMRERLELVGGRLEAGASSAGWTVEATVPA
jgi:signal transduction histidine kinase